VPIGELGLRVVAQRVELWDAEDFDPWKRSRGKPFGCSSHRGNSLLIGWLLTMLALTIERLYRLQYLQMSVR